MSLMLSLFGGCLYTLIKGVQSEAACYNHDYTEVKYCDFGCCGNDVELECCLHGRLVPYIVAGAFFLVVLGIAILLICHRKRKDLKRILNSVSRREIINDNIMNSNNSTMVMNSLSLCAPSTQMMTPPPYYIGPPPPYTINAPHECTQVNMDHSSQPNLISSEARTQYECSCSPNPQTSHQYIEPPPPYGVYADIAHTNRPRT